MTYKCKTCGESVREEVYQLRTWEVRVAPDVLEMGEVSDVFDVRKLQKLSLIHDMENILLGRKLNPEQRKCMNDGLMGVEALLKQYGASRPNEMGSEAHRKWKVPNVRDVCDVRDIPHVLGVCHDRKVYAQCARRVRRARCSRSTARA